MKQKAVAQKREAKGKNINETIAVKVEPVEVSANLPKRIKMVRMEPNDAAELASKQHADSKEIVGLGALNPPPTANLGYDAKEKEPDGAKETGADDTKLEIQQQSSSYCNLEEFDDDLAAVVIYCLRLKQVTGIKGLYWTATHFCEWSRKCYSFDNTANTATCLHV